MIRAGDPICSQTSLAQLYCHLVATIGDEKGPNGCVVSVNVIRYAPFLFSTRWTSNKIALGENTKVGPQIVLMTNMLHSDLADLSFSVFATVRRHIDLLYFQAFKYLIYTANQLVMKLHGLP